MKEFSGAAKNITTPSANFLATPAAASAAPRISGRFTAIACGTGFNPSGRLSASDTAS